MKIGSFSLIKEINTSIILNIIRVHKNISRAQIASLSGLTPATVTNITSKLLDCKLISETKLGLSSGGRKPVILEINSSEYNVACITIGRHKTSVSLYDLDGTLIESEDVNITAMESNEALILLADKINNFICKSEKRVLGVGISCEGLIDPENGTCVFSANLNWENVAIKEIIEKKTNIPAFVDNDVKVIALGEKWFGEAKNSENFVLFYTGYGIGVAAMTNGEIYRGAQNYAGEFGHTLIHIDGPVCSCGKKGCLQAFASGSALLRELNTEYEKEPSIYQIIEDSKTNDKIKEIIKKQAYYIGIGASNAINIFNPSELILNGYVSLFDDETKKIIHDTINEYTLKSMKPELKIIYSSLDTDAVNKGAAALTISNLYNTPSFFFGDKYDL